MSPEKHKFYPNIITILTSCMVLLCALMTFFFVSRSRAIGDHNMPDPEHASETSSETPSEILSEEPTGNVTEIHTETPTNVLTEASTGNDAEDPGERTPLFADPGFSLPSQSGKSADLTGDGAASDSLYSGAAVTIECAGSFSSGRVILSKNADKLIYPASMTKIMTFLVLCENLTDSDLSALVTVDGATVNEMRLAGASGCGLVAGERVYVSDLLYMVLLESDGCACLTLAKYLSGSEEAFVALMNEKAASLGLSDTHFANCTGLHDDSHVSTVTDIAKLFSCALESPAFVKVASAEARKVDTSVYHYRWLSNRTLGMFESSKPTSCSVVCGKSGNTDEARSCLALLVKNKQTGKYYITVSADAPDKYCTVSDHISIYDEIIK